MITLSARKIYLVGIGFLALPVLVWCFGWLKVPYAILVAALLVVGMMLIWRRTGKDALRSVNINISIPLVVAIMVAVLVWCVLGGQGGFLYQSNDWNARNAVLRDLVLYDWPVAYENGNALCYYFGFWLVPALIGKLCVVLGLGASAVWTAANIALLFWTMAGVLIALALFLLIVKRSDSKTIIMAVLIFVFFSGMDIVGLLLTGNPSVIETRLCEKIHIEWWARFYQFSSFTTQLFWVFNQAVPAWIATLLVLSTKRVGNDLFIGVLSAFLCPLPTMGLLFIGMAKLIGEFKTEGVRRTIRAIFSPQNLIALIPLIAIAMFLMLSQRATLATTASGESTLLFHTFIGGFTLIRILQLGLFFMLECGILLLLLLPSERKNPYWWGALILLMVANVVRMGPSPDFAMRASIPGLMVLMVMVVSRLAQRDLHSYYEWFQERRKKPVDSVVAKAHSKVMGIILVICLLVGAVTPLVEMARGPIKMVEAQEIPLPCDKVKTLSNGSDANFVTPNYDDSVFAKTIGK